MQKGINKYLLSASLLLFALVFLFLTNQIYTLTLEDAKRNHQQQQLEMAKVVTEGVRYFVNHLVKDMQLLTNNPSFRTSNHIEFHRFVDQFRLNYDQSIISSIIVRNNSQNEFISGKKPPRWVDRELPNLSGKISTGHTFITSNVYPENPDSPRSEKSFLIILPLNMPIENKAENENSYIAFLVNFDSLIRHFIIPIKLKNNDFIWILDQKGRLIYHPRHEEMLFNSVYEMKEECRSCHESFTEQLKMVKSSVPSYGEYHVKGDEPGKIFAYVPLELENQRWYIAISTLSPDVISGLKDRFFLFFVLGAFIFVTILSFAIIIYYLNLKRIKSDEEKKNLEKVTEYQEQLFHSSKLASIGEIVDSVAHEINTPMGVISAHADSLMLQQIPEIQGLKKDLEVIKKQTRRVSEYTRSLLNFSRRMPFQPEIVDIISLIEESLYLLNPRFREKKITVNKIFPGKTVLLTGDKRQLEQVFVNLLNNSVDAISKNGLITILLKEHNKKIKIHDDEAVERLEIIIEDNGIGISRNELPRIFEPFFTTKKNTGTGLGLSITKSIIQRHKGTISAESSEGKGTKFFILLPRKVSLDDEK